MLAPGADARVMSLEFQRFLRRRGLSPRSVALYNRTLPTIRARARALGLDLETVDVPELDRLCDEFPWTRASRQLLRSTLRWWWDFSERTDPPVAAIRVPGKPRPRCRALDESAAAALESAARADGGPRGLAVLLGLYAALRRAEIAGLRRDQISDGWLEVVGKGDRTRHIPMHPVVAEAFARYRCRSTFVFPGQGGKGHVTPTTVWKWVKELAEQAGIGPVTVHQLRHTSLATALDLTRDLRAVQQFAGHARPETTAIYTRTTSARLIAVVNSIDYRREEP